jgi:hypothetical protein
MLGVRSSEFGVRRGNANRPYLRPSVQSVARHTTFGVRSSEFQVRRGMQIAPVCAHLCNLWLGVQRSGFGVRSSVRKCKPPLSVAICAICGLVSIREICGPLLIREICGSRKHKLVAFSIYAHCQMRWFAPFGLRFTTQTTAASHNFARP